MISVPTQEDMDMEMIRTIRLPYKKSVGTSPWSPLSNQGVFPKPGSDDLPYEHPPVDQLPYVDQLALPATQPKRSLYGRII